MRDSGRPLTQVASELGLEPSVLRRRRSLANQAGQAASAVRPGAAAALSAEQVEIRRLQKELERAQMERDILRNELGPAARLWREKREAVWLGRGERS